MENLTFCNLFEVKEFKEVIAPYGRLEVKAITVTDKLDT